MPRHEVYEPYTPDAQTRVLLAKLIPLVEDYEARGYTLTTRQLFYAAVSSNWLMNTAPEYRNFREVVKRARRGGYLPFASFEDRGRTTSIPLEYASLAENLEAARDTHVLPRWAGQAFYVELAVEKDALVGFLEPLGEELHVPVSSTKGNDGDVPLRKMAQRFRYHRTVLGQQGVLIQGSDHDPTGWDMERDVRERLAMFGAGEPVVTVQRVALTMAQIRAHALPDNPLKIDPKTGTYSDPRAPAYIAATEQTTSWELDALPPETLIDTYRSAVLARRDDAGLAKVLRQEQRDRRTLDQIIRGLGRGPRTR